MARVQKPLISVHDSCRANHRVVFELNNRREGGSYILDFKTGEETVSGSAALCGG